MVNAEAIETIVRRVLTRMLASDAPVASQETASPSASNSVLRLSTSLITMASLPKTLAGVHEIQMASRAVVTPAARDHLRNANVAIVRTADRTNQSDQTNRTDLSKASSPPLIVSGSAAFMPTIHRNVCPRQALVMPTSADDTAALREVSNGLRSGHRAGLVIGTSAHALAWQAARDDKLRPVVVSQWGQLIEILSEVPTNLIILSAKHWNAPAASNVIRAFFKHTIKN